MCYIFLESFLGRLRNYEKQLLGSLCLLVCSSTRPRGTTWPPLDGFSRNFIFEFFSKFYV